jgi:hypothetical protein
MQSIMAAADAAASPISDGAKARVATSQKTTPRPVRPRLLKMTAPTVATNRHVLWARSSLIRDLAQRSRAVNGTRSPRWSPHGLVLPTANRFVIAFHLRVGAVCPRHQFMDIADRDKAEPGDQSAGTAETVKVAVSDGVQHPARDAER